MLGCMDLHLDPEVLVVGGGAAGLSAALVLGRARRRVLVVDAGEQSNRAAGHVGGLLGHDGTPPAALYDLGRAQLAPYPTVALREDRVVGARPDGDGFAVTLASGATATATRIVLAAGMRYAVPELTGAAALWGESVFHCPFCHGWEVRDRPLAVLGAGEHDVMRALLLRGWSDDVVLLTDGPAGLDADARATLAAARVAVEERGVARLLGEHRLTGIELADGTVLAREGLLVPARLEQRSDLVAQLGPELTGLGTVAVDGRGATSVPGLFAAGDVTTTMPSVAAAVAGGSAAAAGVVHNLLVEGAGRAVAA